MFPPPQRGRSEGIPEQWLKEPLPRCILRLQDVVFGAGLCLIPGRTGNDPCMAALAEDVDTFVGTAKAEEHPIRALFELSQDPASNRKE